MPIDPSNTYGGRKAVVPLLAVSPRPNIPSAPTLKKPRFDEEQAPANYYAGVTNMQSYANRLRAGGYNPMQPFGAMPTMYPGSVGGMRPPGVIGYSGTAGPALGAPMAQGQYQNPPWNPEGIAGFNDPTYLPIVEAPLPAEPVGGGYSGGYGGGGGSKRKTAMNVGLVNWRI